MKGQVLITGGLGFIGSHIVDALSEFSQREVFVYDIDAQDGKRKNSTMLKGDIFDSDKLLKVMRDEEISTVIHMIGLAMIPSCEKSPDSSYKLNVASVQAVLETMRLCEADCLIFPSTAAVYGKTNGPSVNEEVRPNPSTVYGSHKLAAEQLIHEYSEKYGLKPCILRLFNVYGDLNKEQGVISLFIRKAIAGEPLLVKGGSQLRDFVFLDDVVKAFINALSLSASKSETINVGSGVGVSINEVAEIVRQNFPTVQIKHEMPNGSEYSIYADISRLRKTLMGTPTPPNIGIQAFVKKCKPKSIGAGA